MSYLFTGADWNVSLIDKMWKSVEKSAKKFGWDFYQPQIEIITAEQMIDNYTYTGLPIMYPHWSFGKEFIRTKNSYDRGRSGLAYEMIINTDPAICYLLENNSAATQILVLAHAAIGHASFFKSNYLFKEWTDAKNITAYLQWASDYILECEEKYGVLEVEETLDACHSLQNYAIDPYKRPLPLSEKQIEQRSITAQELIQQSKNLLYDNLLSTQKFNKSIKVREDNILNYIAINSKTLKPYQRVICSIIENIAQYLYPQGLTKVSNEGWAVFCEKHILLDLYDDNLITEGTLLECLALRSGVTYQSSCTQVYPATRHYSRMVRFNPHYRSINPYTLGGSIYSDIERICKNPTDEDREYLPGLIGKDWKEATWDAMVNYKDSDFILQFLSPKIIREFGLVNISPIKMNSKINWAVQMTSDDDDQYCIDSSIDNYKEIKKTLSNQYSRENYVPEMYVIKYKDTIKNKELTLEYNALQGRPLDEILYGRTLGYIEKLWGEHVECVLAPDIEIDDDLS